MYYIRLIGGALADWAGGKIAGDNGFGTLWFPAKGTSSMSATVFVVRA